MIILNKEENMVKKKLEESNQAKNEKNLSSYNTFKDYHGQQYTGMKIGRRHKWYYDKGEWKEQKQTPDLWHFEYQVTKRRVGKAPEGSGVPIGTEYHWYIMAHQTVKKLNANEYSTEMRGIKYKVAHHRADKANWNISDKAQRKRIIKLLQGMIHQLEVEDVEISQKTKKRVKAPATPK